MQSKEVQLLTELNEEAAMTVARVLNAVNGVAKVSIATASARLHIDFDEDVTSSQELYAVLQRAGFDIRKPASGEAGMCCGSCGG